MNLPKYILISTGYLLAYTLCGIRFAVMLESWDSFYDFALVLFSFWWMHKKSASDFQVGHKRKRLTREESAAGQREAQRARAMSNYYCLIIVWLKSLFLSLCWHIVACKVAANALKEFERDRQTRRRGGGRRRARARERRDALWLGRQPARHIHWVSNTYASVDMGRQRVGSVIYIFFVCACVSVCVCAVCLLCVCLISWHFCFVAHIPAPPKLCSPAPLLHLYATVKGTWRREGRKIDKRVQWAKLTNKYIRST